MSQNRYPQKIANWWIGECLGSGYSGENDWPDVIDLSLTFGLCGLGSS